MVLAALIFSARHVYSQDHDTHAPSAPESKAGKPQTGGAMGGMMGHEGMGMMSHEDHDRMGPERMGMMMMMHNPRLAGMMMQMRGEMMRIRGEAMMKQAEVLRRYGEKLQKEGTAPAAPKASSK
jgi:hypothetical protein